MDLHSNLGFYFAIVALISALIGWLLNSYFSGEKIKEKDSELRRRNSQLNLLAQKVDKEKNENEEKLFHLNDEIRILRGKNIALRKNDSISDEDYNPKAHIDKLSLGNLSVEEDHTLSEEFALIKDENSYLKNEIELLKTSLKTPDNSKAIQKLKRDLKKKKVNYKSLRNEYNLMIVEYNDLLTQYKKLQKKKNQGSESKNAPTVIKEVQVVESIDYKKLKKIILKKLPVITTRKVVNKPTDHLTHG